MTFRAFAVLAAGTLIAGLAGCSGGGIPEQDVPEGDVGVDDTGPADMPGEGDDARDVEDADAPPCPASTLGEALGRDHLMCGGSMRDEEFALAPFDIRYQYVAGDVPGPGPCTSCASGCEVRGESCAGGGCAWWGCWQWDALPPGRFVADFLSLTAEAGAVPMITYYVWYSVAGDVEGTAEVSALTDTENVSRYLADFRFLCRVMNEDPSITPILHVEPDLWGYGNQESDDPATIPARIGAASAEECAGMEDTMAGLAECMLAIARAEAPSVLVGFHASAWGAGHDALINSDPTFDLAGHARSTAGYMRALGAAGGDLVVVEMSDRDAGFNDRWWDETNAALPSFEQAIA